MFTTIQKPNESVEAYYKIFCARRDTVNAHGREDGYHKKLYEKALAKIMTERSRDKQWMNAAYATAANLTEKKAIEK